MTARTPIIVLTGGPCGGKTTFMHELRVEDPLAEKWLLVPEAAPLLFQAGLDVREKSFQQAVVRFQMALESACAEAALPGHVLVCHRGTLDSLAYWTRNGWKENEFFDRTAMNREEHLRRYTGVVHLQTAAVGAERYYRRWPDAHRPETPTLAAESDTHCARAWDSHPRYTFIDNTGRDWLNKAKTARDALNRYSSRIQE